jgi:hypothetical protein
VTFSVPIRLTAGAEISGKAEVSAKAGVRSSLGFEYEGRVRPVGTATPYFKLGHVVEASAGADLTLGPTAEIQAGWRIRALGGIAAKAAVDINSGVKVDYRIDEVPAGTACVPLRSVGSIALYVPLKGKFFSRQKTLLSKDLKYAEL